MDCCMVEFIRQITYIDDATQANDNLEVSMSKVVAHVHLNSKMPS